MLERTMIKSWERKDICLERRIPVRGMDIVWKQIDSRSGCVLFSTERYSHVVLDDYDVDDICADFDPVHGTVYAYGVWKDMVLGTVAIHEILIDKTSCWLLITHDGRSMDLTLVVYARITDAYMEMERWLSVRPFGLVWTRGGVSL